MSDPSNHTTHTPDGLLSVKAIVFDLDGVLIPEDEATTAALEATCALTVPIDDSMHRRLVTAVRETARSLWRAGPATTYCQQIGVSSSEGLCATFSGPGTETAILRAWAPWYRQQVWERGLAAIGNTDRELATRLSERFPQIRASFYCPYPDVIPALSDLSRFYQLGLITNGAADLQRTKLCCAGLADRFTSLIVSAEVGIGKPAAAAYHHLLRAGDWSPEQVLLVEDSLSNIESARQLGIRTLHVARGPSTPPGAIRSLADLPPSLGL